MKTILRGCRTAFAALALSLCAATAHAQELEPVNGRSLYPEGPVMVGDRLFYAEMGSDRVMVYDGSGNREFWTSRGCGPTSIAPIFRQWLLISCHIRHEIVAVPLRDGEVDTSRTERHIAIRRPNDSISDARGGAYFSSSGEFSRDLPMTGAVYYYSPSGKLAKVADDIWYANGVVITNDGRTLLVSEHLGRKVLAYDILAEGALGKRQVYLDINSYGVPDDPNIQYVGPDGLAMDEAGNLFVAIYGAGKVLIIDRNKKKIGEIKLPEPYVTNVTLNASGSTLYITAPASTDDRTPGRVYRLPNPAHK